MKKTKNYSVMICCECILSIKLCCLFTNIAKGLDKQAFKIILVQMFLLSRIGGKHQNSMLWSACLEFCNDNCINLDGHQNICEYFFSAAIYRAGSKLASHCPKICYFGVLFFLIADPLNIFNILWLPQWKVTQRNLPYPQWQDLHVI